VETLRRTEADRDFWFTVSLIAGGVTLYVLNDFQSDQSSDRVQLLLAGGATGYAFWKWSTARGAINDQLVEGRAKGYVQLDVLPLIAPHTLGVQLALRF